MPDITQSFARPAYWQQFEDLTASVARVVYGDPSPQKVGRPGQSQNGLDVLLTAEDGRVIGIQCKRRDEFDHENLPKPGGAITSDALANAIKEIENHPAGLDLFILATSAKTDRAIQNDAAAISAARKKAGKCGVLVWSWADYEAALNRDDRLQNEFYRTVAQGLTAAERDDVMLGMFAEAFDRPAFRDRLNCEHPDDFKQAIEDTQRALATGELMDRDGLRMRRLNGGYRTLSDKSLLKGMDAVSAALDRFRDILLHAERAGQVSQSGRWFSFQSFEVQQELEDARGQVISALNLVLTKAGLPALRQP